MLARLALLLVDGLAFRVRSEGSLDHVDTGDVGHWHVDSTVSSWTWWGIDAAESWFMRANKLQGFFEISAIEDGR